MKNRIGNVSSNYPRYPSVSLSPVHKDPFDRLIIATALDYKAKLASIDGLFSQYPEIDTLLMK